MTASLQVGWHPIMAGRYRTTQSRRRYNLGVGDADGGAAGTGEINFLFGKMIQKVKISTRGLKW